MTLLLQDLTYEHPLTLNQAHPSSIHRSGVLGRSRAVPHLHLELTRPYQPPDPTRAIDWKYYARTQNLIIRQAPQPTALSVVVVCDLAASMYWPGEDIRTRHHLTEPDKAHLGLRMGLHLCHTLLSLTEPVKLLLLLPELPPPPATAAPAYPIRILLPRSRRNLATYAHLLLNHQQTIGGSLPPPAQLLTLLGDIPHQDSLASHHELITWLSTQTAKRIIWISDLISPSRRPHPSPRLHVLHLLSGLEKSLHWTRPGRHYSPRADDERISTRPRYSRRALAGRFVPARRRWLAGLKSELGDHASYHLVYADDPLETYLQVLAEVLG